MAVPTSSPDWVGLRIAEWQHGRRAAADQPRKMVFLIEVFFTGQRRQQWDSFLTLTSMQQQKKSLKEEKKTKNLRKKRKNSLGSNGSAMDIRIAEIASLHARRRQISPERWCVFLAVFHHRRPIRQPDTKA